MALDAQGNCFITGSYGGDADFGSTQLPGFGDGDIFVAKYDATGNLIWVRGAGGPDDDVGRGLALDAEGNLLVTGYFRRTASFGTNVLTADHTLDMFIAAYGPDGDLNWVRQYGVGGVDLAESIAIDNDGALYVCGTFTSRTTSFGGIVLTNGYQSSGASHDIFVAKLDHSGNVLWAQRAGGGNDNGADYARALGLDNSGNIFVAGTCDSLAPTFGPFTLGNLGGGYMPYLAKYDGSGNVLWARKLVTGGDGFAVVFDLAVDPNGNSHVTGSFANTVVIDGQVLSNAGNPNTDEGFAAKFDANGGLLWAIAGGATEWDTPAAIALDGQGNSYVAGAYWGAWSFGGFALPAIGPSYALCIFKIDTGGIIQWAYGAGSPSGDAFGRSIVADASGHTRVGGTFRPGLVLGQTNLTGRGSYDLFLFKGPRPAPAITTQPLSQTVNVGDTVTFGVIAVGEAPLSYQWLFNGTDIPGATGSTLTLTNTVHSQAGFYSVSVSNQAGTVASTAAQLMFTFLTLGMYAGLTIDGEAGESYRVEFASVLGHQTNWEALANVTLTNAPYLFIDVDSPTARQRYYRAVPLP